MDDNVIAAAPDTMTAFRHRAFKSRLKDAEQAVNAADLGALRGMLPDLVAEAGRDVEALVPLASAMVSRAAFDEADLILRAVITEWPARYPAYEAYGNSAFHRRDFFEAASRWRSAYEAFPDDPRPCVHLAASLMLVRRVDEAEAVLRAAADRFPNNVEIARDLAKLPLARDDLAGAVTQLIALSKRFPDHVEGYALGAEALRLLGRFDEAEALLESVRDRFETNYHFCIQTAWTATRMGRWEEAFRRWDALLSRYGTVHGVDMAVGDAIMLWHLAAAEGDEAATTAKLPPEIARRAGTAADGLGATAPVVSDRALMMRFESLGDRCEFGLVQRHFGAEPISLLRWSGIEPDKLVALLDCRLQGVGEPGNSFVRVNGGSKEYFAGDNRFFYMHTFIKENEASERALFDKFCQRMSYLKRKLLDDLAAGEKIFVYKADVGHLSEAQGRAISEVLARHYPDARIMLMRMAGEPAQVGTVAPLAGNAIWGFMSKFAENLESRFILFNEWRAVCASAARYFAARSANIVFGEIPELPPEEPAVPAAGIDVARAMEAAITALRRDDQAEAQAQWRLARTAENAPAEAWILAATHSIPGQDDPVALLDEAAERFPANARVLHDLARARERLKDWPAAEAAWRSYIKADPGKWWAYTALAAALRAQDADDDADAVLAEGILRLPDEPAVIAESARLKQGRGDWAEALRRWDAVIERFPRKWIGYRGKIVTLAQSGSARQADELMEQHAGSFPHDVDALHDLARFAERHRSWKRAEAAWRAFIELEQRASWAYLALVGALREQGELAEADMILQDARERFPADPRLASEAAKCSEARGDWVEAIRRWRAVDQLSPRSAEGTLAEADLLRAQGLSLTADDVIRAAIARLGEEPALLEAYGQNAIAREAWSEAMARFEAGQKRFPADDTFRRRVFEVGVRIAGEIGLPAPSAANEAAAPDSADSASADRAIVMAFESLGGGGHGCEFGIFQRSFGAEPLGLLRWADIYQDQLTQALNTDFAGVGEPEFTNIFVPPGGHPPEYWTTDTRYHMAMRCFVKVEDVPLDRMTVQVRKRLSYLRGKLIDDLKSGSKIFVYKNMKRNLTDEELGRLHAACRRFGDNTLFYIRYEDAAHPCGTVVPAADGLMIGYIDRFSHTPDTDEFLGAATDSLLRLCRKAYSLWQDTASLSRQAAQ